MKLIFVIFFLLILITNISADQSEFDFNYPSSTTFSLINGTVIDTNASTECGTDEVLLGNETCYSIATLPGGAGGDNLSWNESGAAEIFAGIEWDYNQTTATYNSYGQWWYNQSLATFEMWNSTWALTCEASTDTNASTECGTDEVLLGNETCYSIATLPGGDATWDYNQTTATFDSYGQWWYNQTLGTFNSYSQWWYNQTLGTYTSYNDAWSDKNSDISAPTNCSNGDEILLQNETCYAISTLPSGDATWDYNQTTATFDSYGQWWYNQSLGIFNSFGEYWYNQTLGTFNSYGEYWYNQTLGTHTSYNTVWSDKNSDISAPTNCSTGNEVLLQNGTCYAISTLPGGDATWDYNQTTATFDSYGQWWYNQSLATFEMWNSTWALTYEASTDTNASTECNDGYYLDGDESCYHFNDSVKNLFSEEQVVYNATVIATVNGTLDSGDLESVKVLGDGDTYNVSELSGADPLTIAVNFTGVVNFNTFAMRGRYDGGAGHSIEVQLWRVGVGWETREEITDQVEFGVTTFPIFIGSDFIDSGLVRMRLYHDDTGTPSHDYFLDAIFLGQVTGLVSGGSLGDLTERDEACELLPEVFCKDGSKNMIGSLNMSNNNITNINYIRLNEVDGPCDLSISGSICMNSTGTYIVG